MAIRVTVWNEYLHEGTVSGRSLRYTRRIHGCIADFLEGSGDGGKDGDLEGAGARSDPGSAGQHGCADLVGGIWLTTRYEMR